MFLALLAPLSLSLTISAQANCSANSARQDIPYESTPERDITFIGCGFISQTAPDGEPYGGGGGAIKVGADKSNFNRLTVQSCSFVQCTAPTRDGGAILAFAYAPSISDSTATGCSAGRGAFAQLTIEDDVGGCNLTETSVAVSTSTESMWGGTMGAFSNDLGNTAWFRSTGYNATSNQAMQGSAYFLPSYGGVAFSYCHFCANTGARVVDTTCSGLSPSTFFCVAIVGNTMGSNSPLLYLAMPLTFTSCTFLNNAEPLIDFTSAPSITFAQCIFGSIFSTQVTIWTPISIGFLSSYIQSVWTMVGGPIIQSSSILPQGEPTPDTCPWAGPTKPFVQTPVFSRSISFPITAACRPSRTLGASRLATTPPAARSLWLVASHGFSSSPSRRRSDFLSGSSRFTSSKAFRSADLRPSWHFKTALVPSQVLSRSMSAPSWLSNGFSISLSPTESSPIALSVRIDRSFGRFISNLMPRSVLISQSFVTLDSSNPEASDRYSPSAGDLVSFVIPQSGFLQGSSALPHSRNVPTLARPNMTLSFSVSVFLTRSVPLLVSGSDSLSSLLMASSLSRSVDVLCGSIGPDVSNSISLSHGLASSSKLHPSNSIGKSLDNAVSSSGRRSKPFIQSFGVLASAGRDMSHEYPYSQICCISELMPESVNLSGSWMVAISVVEFDVSRHFGESAFLLMSRSLAGSEAEKPSNLHGHSISFSGSKSGPISVQSASTDVPGTEELRSTILLRESQYEANSNCLKITRHSSNSDFVRFHESFPGTVSLLSNFSLGYDVSEADRATAHLQISDFGDESQSLGRSRDVWVSRTFDRSNGELRSIRFSETGSHDPDSAPATRAGLAVWLWPVLAVAVLLLLSVFAVLFIRCRRKSTPLSTSHHDTGESLAELDIEPATTHEYWNPLDGGDPVEGDDVALSSGEYETCRDDGQATISDQDLTLQDHTDPGPSE